MSQYIRMLFKVMFSSLFILIYQNSLLTTLIVIFIPFNAVQKTMPTKCLFPTFCWATSRVQWYLLFLSFTFLLFSFLMLQALYIYSMLQRCVTSVHGQERWKKWISLVCCS